MAEKKLRPGQKIKMVSVDELLGCAGEESSLEIDINRIQPFQNHPFKVVDDAKMDDLVNSIRQNIEFAESKNAGGSGDSGFGNIPEEMEAEMPFR